MKKNRYIKINRTGIFIIGVLLILAFYLQERLKVVWAGKITQGEIVSIIDAGPAWEQSIQSRTCAKFEHPDYGTLYAENLDPGLPIGYPVKVIYNKKSPAIATVFTFYSFWARNLLFYILPIVVWIAFSLGYVHPKKVIKVKAPFN